LAELGWHIQLWIDVKDSPDTASALKTLGTARMVDDDRNAAVRRKILVDNPAGLCGFPA
jgi:hypothetical protein